MGLNSHLFPIPQWTQHFAMYHSHMIHDYSEHVHACLLWSSFRSSHLRRKTQLKGSSSRMCFATIEDAMSMPVRIPAPAQSAASKLPPIVLVRLALCVVLLAIVRLCVMPLSRPCLQFSVSPFLTSSIALREKNFCFTFDRAWRSGYSSFFIPEVLNGSHRAARAHHG